jgi:hypothetical protein
MYQRLTASGAAGSGLSNATKCLRGAACIGVSTAIKYYRRTTSGDTGRGLSTTMKYLRCADGIGLDTTIKYCDAIRTPPRVTALT